MMSLKASTCTLFIFCFVPFVCMATPSLNLIIAMDIAVMTTNGVPCVDWALVDQDIKVTNERLAQVGSRIRVDNKRTFEAPDIIATNLYGWAVRYGNGVNDRRVTTEAKAVVDAANPAPENLCMIYVPRIHAIPNSSGVTWGTAIAPYYYTNPADFNYLGHAFIAAADNQSRFTFAHELLHIFDLVHVLEQWNLMYPTPSIINTVSATKRLTLAQENTMKAKYQ